MLVFLLSLLGGIYTIPAHVSPGARDLISRMLVVDPLQRITMNEIVQHPWYKTNLPAYLALSAEQQIERTHAIDEQVLQKVVNVREKESNMKFGCKSCLPSWFCVSVSDCVSLYFLNLLV